MKNDFSPVVALLNQPKLVAGKSNMSLLDLYNIKKTLLENKIH